MERHLICCAANESGLSAWVCLAPSSAKLWSQLFLDGQLKGKWLNWKGLPMIKY